MEKINVFLDDLRKCPSGFVLAKNTYELIDLFDKNDIKILSLDHDLGLDESGNLLPTGYDFVKYFCENGLFVEEIYLHTDNVVGRENMYQTLLSAQRRDFIDKRIKIRHYPLTKNKY